MIHIDLITAAQFILGVIWGTGLLMLLKRNKSKPEIWPRIFGVGGGIYMFVMSMITSIFHRPSSELVNYTVTNFFWSLALGVVTYFSGRILARRFGKQ